MARPTHILRHEHRVIEQGLRALDGICLKFKTGERVPAGTLSLLLDFIRNFAIQFHHAREEELLFPALLRVGVREEGGALGFLRDEHLLERQLVAELELVIDEYGNGDDHAADRFIQAATAFRDHLANHMQQEDAMLFSLAEELLDEPAKLELLRAFNRDEEGHARYEEIAAALEREWAV
ncbi:MAG: hemerythrin domain-containing protein [Blastocatellia bacterium]